MIVNYKKALAEFQRKYLLALMMEAEGSITIAAKLSGRSRTELYRFLRYSDLEPLDFAAIRPNTKEVTAILAQMEKELPDAGPVEAETVSEAV